MRPRRQGPGRRTSRRWVAATGLALLAGVLGACSAASRPPQAGRPADDVLAIVQAVRWGMTQQEVRGRFPEKAFVPAASEQGHSGIAFITGYRDRIEGDGVFVGFHFTSEDRLVRIAWSFDASADASRAERLYGAYTDRFRRRFGVPLVEAASGITTARWKTAYGILIVGTTAKPGFAIQAWHEPYFAAAARAAR